MASRVEKPFYITTTLPYVNAEPHIGHAMEFIRADVIARTKKLSGFEVFFNTGVDEHGQKIYQKAKQTDMETQAFVDKNAAKFKEILPLLGMMPEVNFVRTTDSHHVKAAQEFWRIVDKKGYIYKKHYSIKYCIGCELEKTDSELINGRCPLHPLQELEIIQEENYFFKFSAFQKNLLQLYASHPDFVIPDFRFNEIKAFVERGLEDFSISRLKSKMPWGIEVPGDSEQVMYVWFDALVNYISAIGWPDRKEDFNKWWVESGGVVQYCGKDNLRHQSAMWQAMLMAAGLPPSKTIIINGWVTGEGGVKMSKSLGNTVDPLDIVKEYGTDALRYYVTRELSPFEDSPFTLEHFKEAYNAGLANGIGNLTSRIMKMAVENSVSYKDYDGVSEDTDIGKNFYSFGYARNYDGFNIKKEADDIWGTITALDIYIQREQPFKKVKSDPINGKKDIAYLLSHLLRIAVRLESLMPQTSSTIQNLVRKGQMPETPLFARK